MPTHPIFDDLQEQSTWRLVGLSLITYGVYGAYYCRRQIRTLNPHLSTDQTVSPVVGNVMIIANWLSLGLYLSLWLVDTDYRVQIASYYVDLATVLLFMFCGLVMRRRINRLVRACPGDDIWHNLFWTLLFPPYYFNYKVNRFSHYTAGRPDEPEYVEE